jgi:hypothetical protein
VAAADVSGRERRADVDVLSSDNGGGKEEGEELHDTVAVSARLDFSTCSSILLDGLYTTPCSLMIKRPRGLIYVFPLHSSMPVAVDDMNVWVAPTAHEACA